MGKVGKAITKPFRKIGKAVGKVFGVSKPQSSQTVDYSTGAVASSPAAPAPDATNNDTNVETEATKRKKKAAGKKSLMIGGGGDAPGGGITGTGLNL